MRDSQTIDLRDDSTRLGEQARVIDRLGALRNAGTMAAWSDDHALETLMLRYEAAARSVSNSWFGE